MSELLVGAGVGQNRTPLGSAVQAWPNGCGPLAATADGVADNPAMNSTAKHNQRCVIPNNLLPRLDGPEKRNVAETVFLRGRMDA